MLYNSMEPCEKEIPIPDEPNLRKSVNNDEEEARLAEFIISTKKMLNLKSFLVIKNQEN